MILHYILWFGILFKYHVKMMCMAFSNHMTGVTSRPGTGNPSETPECSHPHPRFSVIRVAQSLVFCVVFCRSLFVYLCIFFWPLYCLSLYFRLLITPLIPSKLFKFSEIYVWSIFTITMYTLHIQTF